MIIVELCSIIAVKFNKFYMMFAGKSIYSSRRSNTLRCSARNEDCKLIGLWRISSQQMLRMSAEGESTVSCESLRQKDKVYLILTDIIGIPVSFCGIPIFILPASSYRLLMYFHKG